MNHASLDRQPWLSEEVLFLLFAHSNPPLLQEMFGFGKRLRFRPRKGDMHMLYVAATVGIVSGYYIFAAPLQQMKEDREVR